MQKRGHIRGALLLLLGLAACADDPLPLPSDGFDSGTVRVDSGSRDDGGDDDDGSADSGEMDASLDGSFTDASMADAELDAEMISDAGQTDVAPSAPMITSLSWEPGAECTAGSGMSLTVQVSDADTPLSDLTVEVILGSCAQGATNVVGAVLVVDLDDCANDAPVSGLVRVTDPGGLSDMENGFVVFPCEEGGFVP